MGSLNYELLSLCQMSWNKVPASIYVNLRIIRNSSICVVSKQPQNEYQDPEKDESWDKYYHNIVNEFQVMTGNTAELPIETSVNAGQSSSNNAAGRTVTKKEFSHKLV